MTVPENELDSTATKTPDVQDVVTLLLERALATADVTTTTLKLAVAEARLAASSAGLMVAFVVVLIVMIPITWLVALATAFAALQSMGLSALWSLLILLAVQLVVCALIVWTILKLSRLLAFNRTREALRSSLTSTEDNQPQPTEADSHVTNNHQA